MLDLPLSIDSQLHVDGLATDDIIPLSQYEILCAIRVVNLSLIAWTIKKIFVFFFVLL